MDFNSLLKNEIPHFLQLTTAFISPLFQTFYFVKVGILCKFQVSDRGLLLAIWQLIRYTDTILEKIQSWGGQTYGEMGVEGLEEMHAHRIGDTAERYEELTINKRFVGTGKYQNSFRSFLLLVKPIHPFFLTQHVWCPKYDNQVHLLHLHH